MNKKDSFCENLRFQIAIDLIKMSIRFMPEGKSKLIWKQIVEQFLENKSERDEWDEENGR